MKEIYNEQTKQLLDYCLIPELIANTPSGAVERVRERILNFSVDVAPIKIYQRIKQIKEGAVIKPLAEFKNIPDKREGKDQNYAGIWAILDMFIPHQQDRKYIGLACNQIDVVSSQVGKHITVCEKDPCTYRYLMKYREFLKSRAQSLGREFNLIVCKGDIFWEINRSKNKYNIFDLDLMSILPPPEKLDMWAKYIRGAATDSNIVIHLTTAVGRKITHEEYQKRIVYFRVCLVAEGFEEVAHSSFKYKDRITPMVSERLVLKKGEQK